MGMIRLLISQATQFKWSIYHMEAKSTLLNGVLPEVVYVKQPPGFMRARNETNVLKLRKALYRLKRAPGTWNTQIDSYLKKNRYLHCLYEHALYLKKDGKKLLFVALYVDGIIFEKTDLGLMKYFIDLEIRQCKFGIFVSQEGYAKYILKKSKMEECNPVATPMELGTKLSKFKGEDRMDATQYCSVVRSLRYFTFTRSDIAYSVGVVSQFMEDPMTPHWKAKRARNREVQLNHVASRDQVADIFTKALPTELFNNFKLMLEMKDGRDLSLREDFVNDKLKSHVN
ncbi:retrovirus-related pol polyprotein from transposon TNT 1-94 [Tanacetum coccineum]